MQPAAGREGRDRPGALHHRQIAGELDRVAEAVIVQHQHALARSARPAPLGKAHAERLVERLSRDPARFVAFPTAFEIAERQIEAALAADRLDGCRAASACSNASRASSRRPSARSASAWPHSAVGIIGLDRTRQTIGFERLRGAVEFQQRVAEIERRFGEIGPQAQRFARRRGRFLQPTKLAQRPGAAVPQVGVAGPEGERRLEAVERLGDSVRVRKELAGVRPGDRQIELEARARAGRIAAPPRACPIRRGCSRPCTAPRESRACRATPRPAARPPPRGARRATT